LLAVSLALVVAKAVLGPVTTDEAWGYNDWLSVGFGRIWTDYTHHMLHNLLARASLLAFGDSELALRLPSVIGFVLLLGSSYRLARRLIESRAIRFLFLANVAYHPYLIDFGACARGYLLGLGLAFVAFDILSTAVDSDTAPSGFLLVAASVAFGLAASSTPLYLNLMVPAAAAFLLVRYDRPLRVGRSAAALVLPALGVLLAVYAGVLTQLRPRQFSFGFDSAADSIASFFQLFTYEPQSLVDATGFPEVRGPLVAWRHGPLPDGFHNLFSTPLFRTWLGVLTFLSVAAAFLRLRGARRAPALPALTLAFGSFIIPLLHFALGAPWPFHRTWIYVVPLLLLSLHISAGTIVGSLEGRMRSGAQCASVALSIFILLNSLGRVSLAVYREWPDNTPVRDALGTIERLRDSSQPLTSVGIPWYQDACFRYYRTRNRLQWLQIPARPRLAENPGWDFVLVSRRMDAAKYSGYETVKTYDAFGLVLMRRKGSR